MFVIYFELSQEIRCRKRLMFLILMMILLIIRKDGNIVTDWYQKPTFSGRLLNFNSRDPFAHKKGVIYNLVDRAILLSDQFFHKNNFHKVKQILPNYQYSIKIIKKFVNFRFNQCLNKLSENNNRTSLNNSDESNNRNSYLCNCSLLINFI